MSDKIGILGRNSSPIVGTATVYTCPNNKGAKGRLIFSGVNAAVGNATIEIFVGGISIFKSANIAVSNFVYSIRGDGLINSATQAAQPDGTTAAKTVQPAHGIYFLSPGDTVQYIIAGNAFASFQCQFIGAEVDVS